MLKALPFSRLFTYQAYRCKKVSFVDFRLFRHGSDFSAISSDLTSRQLPLLYDDCSSLPSHLLSTSLSDFLPIFPNGYPDISSARNSRLLQLPFAHHLVYFPPPTSLSTLFSDGTDPLHSPGPPFTRRMWAGGVITLPFPRIELNKDPAYCAERIRKVTVKGPKGAEKIFVQIERYLHQTPLARFGSNAETPELNSPKFDGSRFVELRSLVFMRGNLPNRYPGSIDGFRLQKPMPLPTPDISHTLVPTAALLFRFSALTFNAHAIHLDRRYCQEVESYRNLLVHGPLSLLFMTELLSGHLATEAFRAAKESAHELESRDAWRAEHIIEMEYKNLAPLYAEEEMRVCGRRTKKNEWELWIEGKERRLATRGLAKTTIARNPDMNHFGSPNPT